MSFPGREHGLVEEEHFMVEEPWEAIEKGGKPLQRIKRAQL